MCPYFTTILRFNFVLNIQSFIRHDPRSLQMLAKRRRDALGIFIDPQKLDLRIFAVLELDLQIIRVWRCVSGTGLVLLGFVK